MTVQELIEALEEYDPEATVHLMEQPSWPFEYSIGEIVECGPDCGQRADEEDEVSEDGPDEVTVYIGEGQQVGYLPGAPAGCLGWGRGR